MVLHDCYENYNNLTRKPPQMPHPLRRSPAFLGLFLSAFLVSQPVARAVLVIDDFDAFSFLSVGGPPAGGMSNFAAYSTSQALGLERDAVITRDSANSGSVSMDISGSVASQLSYASAPFTSGQLMLSYDGIDGSAGLNPIGLGNIDITQSGANTGLFLRSTSDLGAELVFTIYTDANHFSTATIPILADSSFTFQDYFTPFALFASGGSLGGADFTRVGAITLWLDGSTPGTDVSLETIISAPTPVPEPGSSLLLGLAAMTYLRHRRRA